MKNGWFCVHRKIKDWEWYSDPYTTKIFYDCLASAYFSDSEWRGIKIKKGQFPTTVETLATLNGLTTQQTRTALKNLQITNEIEIQTTNRYSIITVKNWDFHQGNNKQKTNSNNKQDRGGANKQNGGSNNKPNNNNINNITNTNSNTSYINISSSSSIENFPKITEEEEEILKNHSKRNKIRYFKPWLRKILTNGDYLDILKLEKAKQAKAEEVKKEKEQLPEESSPEEIEQIKRIQERIKKKGKERQ